MTLTACEVTAAEAPFDRVSKTIPHPLSWGAALWSVVSVRWATVALLLFLAGLVAQLNGAPEAMWWTLYLACYLAGGWGSAWAGAQALRNKALDVDLLMIAAAVGAVAIGQIFDGALLIVIFATSGALDDIATRHTAESVKGLLDLAPVAVVGGCSVTAATAAPVAAAVAASAAAAVPVVMGLSVGPVVRARGSATVAPAASAAAVAAAPPPSVATGVPVGPVVRVGGCTATAAPAVPAAVVAAAAPATMVATAGTAAAAVMPSCLATAVTAGPAGPAGPPGWRFPRGRRGRRGRRCRRFAVRQPRHDRPARLIPG